MTTTDNTTRTDLVNWSIRLSATETDQWNDIVHTLRKTTGRRTLSKADIMRALLTLAADSTGTVMLTNLLRRPGFVARKPETRRQHHEVQAGNSE